MSGLVNLLNDGPEEARLQSTGTDMGRDVAKQLQSLMLRLKGEFMAEDGRGVNYAGLRESELFKEYQLKSRELKSVDVGILDVAEKKCFFISIHPLCVVQSSIKYRRWRTLYWYW